MIRCYQYDITKYKNGHEDQSQIFGFRHKSQSSFFWTSSNVATRQIYYLCWGLSMSHSDISGLIQAQDKSINWRPYWRMGIKDKERLHHWCQLILHLYFNFIINIIIILIVISWLTKRAQIHFSAWLCAGIAAYSCYFFSSFLSLVTADVYLLMR